MDGWMEGWKDGSQSPVKDCLQQSKTKWQKDSGLSLRVIIVNLNYPDSTEQIQPRLVFVSDRIKTGVNPIKPVWPKLHKNICSKSKFKHVIHQF